METCKDEPKVAREIPEREPKPRRFRIVKLEERIAPLSGGGETRSNPTLQPTSCAN
jgi:hypothetical protein